MLSNSQEWEKIGQVGEARIPLLRSAVQFQALLIRLRFITAESEDFQRGIIVLLFSFWCAIFFLNAQPTSRKLLGINYKSRIKVKAPYIFCPFTNFYDDKNVAIHSLY